MSIGNFWTVTGQKGATNIVDGVLTIGEKEESDKIKITAQLNKSAFNDDKTDLVDGPSATAEISINVGEISYVKPSTTSPFADSPNKFYQALVVALVAVTVNVF